IDERPSSLSRSRHESRHGIKICRGRMAIPTPNPKKWRLHTFNGTQGLKPGFCNRREACASAAKNLPYSMEPTAYPTWNCIMSGNWQRVERIWYTTPLPCAPVATLKYIMVKTRRHWSHGYMIMLTG